MRLLEKTVIFAFTFFCLSVFFSNSTQAFSTPSDASYQLQFEQAVYQTEEMNLQSYVYETMKAIAGSVVTKITGCLSCDEEGRKQNPGLVMNIGSLVATAYANPPASGKQYLAYLQEKMDIIQPAYAQESAGFRAMEKVLPVWTAFRNISYVFFALILVLIGFAIMFRVKISPQAVITIQSALPKIVVALILITFSYAIVGLLIDLMYVLTHLMISIFASIPLIGDWKVQNLYDLVNEIPFMQTGISPNQKAIISAFFSFLIVPIFAFFFLLTMGPIGWLIAVITIIFILFTFLRCAWTLLKAFAMIVIHLVFAPFEILMGTLPGSNAISNWFKNVLANIAVLPTMVAMFFLSSYLIFAGISGVVSDPVEFLRLIITGWLPGIGGIWASLNGLFGRQIGNWQFLSSLILPLTGLFILFMAPKVSDIIKSFITGEPFKYGAAIGQTFGPITSPLKFAGIIGIKSVEDYAKERVKVFFPPWGEEEGKPRKKIESAPVK